MLLSFALTACAPETEAEGTDYSANSTGSELYDVHGAGAQRSDPKSGDPADFAGGHGPQGDVVRIYNYVRCVRGATSGLPDTDQEHCYDDGTEGSIACPGEGEAFAGQDAAYEGEGPAYEVDDEVVVDIVTGLSWTRAFYEAGFGERDEVAASATDGGHDDWRVPTIDELYSLIAFSGATGTGDLESTTVPDDAVPYLDDGVFDFEYPDTDRYIDAQYLTDTQYVSEVTVASQVGPEEVFFGVNFADGRIKGYPLGGTGGTAAYYVRLVRGGDGYGEAAYVDNGDDTITDGTTGLTWSRTDEGPLDWEEALAFCEDLELADHDDWRLPDAKELQSLVDYTLSPDTTDSAAIDPLFASTSIVDEEGGLDWPFYWSSTTHDDGPVEGAWAVYVAFGEAKGYGGM